MAASLGRGLTGFLIAVATAIPLGMLVGLVPASLPTCSTRCWKLFRNTAALALLPVFVLILGIGETSKIALVVYACTFPILLNTITGVRTVDPLLVKAAVSLGFSPVSVFQKVVLPAAVPTIFTGIRMAGASSILVLVAAEMVGAKRRARLPRPQPPSSTSRSPHVRGDHRDRRARPAPQPAPGVPGTPLLSLAPRPV